MNAIEFTTKVEKGLKIKLPKEHPELASQIVRVIILSETKQNLVSRKEKLIAAFNEMKGMNMFSKIKDPLTWQKQQRNEWE
jgi:hypothetical protein